MAKFEYEYYSYAEGDQFRFLRIPKVFFEDPDYDNLGSDEKILYGFLHEQVDLSRKKGWIDEDGHIYVIRSLESIQQILHNCSADKARNTLNNLVEFGLIEKKRRGQGKPDLIYVKNFITKKPEKPVSEKSRDGKEDFSETEKSGLLNKKKPVSGNRNFRFQETGNSDPKETLLKDTIGIETPSIHQESTTIPDQSIRLYVSGDGLMDGNDQPKTEREAYERVVKANIDYDLKMHDLKRPEDRKLFDSLYNLIIEVLVGDAGEYRINKTVFPQEVVKSRLLKLTSEDLMVVMEQLSRVEDGIHNYRSYMISALYNAPVTTETFIMADSKNAVYGTGRK